jgi:hypothetical protein
VQAGGAQRLHHHLLLLGCHPCVHRGQGDVGRSGTQLLQRRQGVACGGRREGSCWVWGGGAGGWGVWGGGRGTFGKAGDWRGSRMCEDARNGALDKQRSPPPRPSTPTTASRPPTGDAEVEVLGQLPGSCRVGAEGLPRALVGGEPAESAAVGASAGGGGPGRAAAARGGLAFCVHKPQEQCGRVLAQLTTSTQFRAQHAPGSLTLRG